MAIPKVAAIHDRSGLGKCSLTAAIPILSVCGVQAVPLATAVLSNQTAFESYTGVDLSEYLPMIAAEWKKRKLSLDGIFTGYLSNEQQVEWVGGFTDSFAKDDTLILVDPVLGDEGVYYRGFGEQMRLAMRRLCGKADVITPNLTEALLLLGEDASRAKQPFGQEEIRQFARRLSALGPKTVIVTGIEEEEKIWNIGFDAGTQQFFAVSTQPLTALWFTNKQEKLFNRHNLIGVLIAGAVSIVGYYLAEVILVGSWTAPLLTIWGNVVQAVGSGILFVVMSFAIDRVSLKKKLESR